MRFLFRMFILGFIGLAVLPAFVPAAYRDAAADRSPDAAPAPSPFKVAAVVGEAVSDIRGICDRRPDVCETGGELFSYAGSRAREGLVIAYSVFRHGHPSMKQETATDELTPRPAALVPNEGSN